MKRDNADLIRLTTLFAAILGLLSSFARISSGQQLVAPDSKTVEQPGVITGRVVSRGGEPISDGAVFVTPLGSSFMPKSVSVDSAGTFKFNVANAGLYRVWASVPGYTPDFSLTTDDSSHYFHAGDSLTLIMIKGGVITGKVTRNFAARAFPFFRSWRPMCVSCGCATRAATCGKLSFRLANGSPTIAGFIAFTVCCRALT